MTSSAAAAGHPAIGITCSAAVDETGKPPASVQAYVDAVERAGGRAVLLANDAAHLDASLAMLTGIVLSGGVDVNPACYGGRRGYENAPQRYRDDRDAFERALVVATRDRGIPTLCICRGLQIANVAFGGTLVEDIPAEFGARALAHDQTAASGLGRGAYAPGHEVEVGASSALARIAGRTRFATNSIHHQAVREVGEGLTVTGRTPDGIVEALEATFPHPYFIAVQWHPEALPDDPIAARLFEELVAATMPAGSLAR